MRVSPVLPLLFAMSATLAACDHNFDSVARLNDVPFGDTVPANLAAMVADPADLVRGHGGGLSGSRNTANAVDRVGTDHEKALLKTGGNVAGGGGGG
jgi:type IV pilus biogenesis protein CpaD/CtpE